MFTGIVTRRGRVEEAAASDGAGGTRLVVSAGRPYEGLAVGDSVAVDGCCLTVTDLDGDRMAFDVVPETLRRTTLGDRVAGDRVNLEAALRVGDPLGGHLVQGHVDGVGTVRDLGRRGEDVRMEIALPADLAGDVLPKGSVTVDGVSLTVGEVGREPSEERFSVYLIPHTLEVTGLGAKGPGDRVNLEMDVIGRWVRHHLARDGGPAA